MVAALERGYDGLRISGSTFSLARDDWESFVRYEAAIDRIVGYKRISRDVRLFAAEVEHERNLRRHRNA
ncbi:hypothetical protein [Methylocystis echinoides]|uniref:hypothetical protein n=1 Tax=Methylocystis echinoides TaxID=29468 RepID=UPI003444AF33